MHGRAELGRNRNCPHTLFTVDALTHTHALPTVNSFLMSAGFPCPAGVDQWGGKGRGRGGFRGVHKLLKVWRNQKFFKSFLWYINMKAKPVQDER